MQKYDRALLTSFTTAAEVRLSVDQGNVTFERNRAATEQLQAGKADEMISPGMSNEDPYIRLGKTPVEWTVGDPFLLGTSTFRPGAQKEQPAQRSFTVLLHTHVCACACVSVWPGKVIRPWRCWKPSRHHTLLLLPAGCVTRALAVFWLLERDGSRA